jgi:hypothetical protein
MIKPGDRPIVLAFLRAQSARGFGVSAGQACGQRGLGGRGSKRLNAAEARSLLDEMVLAGLASVAMETTRLSDGRRGVSIRVYRAVPTTPNQPRESGRAAPDGRASTPAAPVASRRTRGAR